MTQYKYLIIGGGVASLSAAAGIRQKDPRGNIGICSAQSNLPYSHSALSRGLWRGAPLDSIWLKVEGQPVELLLRRKIVSIDPRARTVTDSQKGCYGFDRLLIATGGIPRPLSFGGDRVNCFRTLDDYRKLRALADEKQRFGIIGGGLLGSELASALVGLGREVVMMLPEPGVLGLLLPADLARFLNERVTQQGIEVRPGESVTDLKIHGAKLGLMNQRFQETTLVDAVVCAAGVVPDLELAERSWLTSEDGIKVDEFLRTSNPTIFAAGDVAQFSCVPLGKRLRVAHEDCARAMGRHAGLVMAGERKPFNYLPSFSFESFGFQGHALGDVDARLETYSHWLEPFLKGTVYYLERNRVRGVLFWNVAGDKELAAKLIAQTTPVNPDDLKGRLPFQA